MRKGADNKHHQEHVVMKRRQRERSVYEQTQNATVKSAVIEMPHVTSEFIKKIQEELQKIMRRRYVK